MCKSSSPALLIQQVQQACGLLTDQIYAGNIICVTHWGPADSLWQILLLKQTHTHTPVEKQSSSKTEERTGSHLLIRKAAEGTTATLKQIQEHLANNAHYMHITENSCSSLEWRVKAQGRTHKKTPKSQITPNHRAKCVAGWSMVMEVSSCNRVNVTSHCPPLVRTEGIMGSSKYQPVKHKT